MEKKSIFSNVSLISHCKNERVDCWLWEGYCLAVSFLSIPLLPPNQIFSLLYFLIYLFFFWTKGGTAIVETIWFLDWLVITLYCEGCSCWVWMAASSTIWIASGTLATQLLTFSYTTACQPFGSYPEQQLSINIYQSKWTNL